MGSVLNGPKFLALSGSIGGQNHAHQPLMDRHLKVTSVNSKFAAVAPVCRLKLAWKLSNMPKMHSEMHVVVGTDDHDLCHSPSGHLGRHWSCSVY